MLYEVFLRGCETKQGRFPWKRQAEGSRYSNILELMTITKYLYGGQRLLST